jgi:signal recognition particle subunit SRP54
MFENLSSKLETVFKKLRGHGKLTEENIQEALKEVRIALLEADVHFKVVKDFIQSVQQRAIGQEVMASLTPAQQLIKIVQEELTSLMGATGYSPLDARSTHSLWVTVLGNDDAANWRYFRRRRNVLLIPADVYRPRDRGAAKLKNLRDCH